MRPYLAILTDSFREAFHSRVLWVVLLLITLLYVVLFPLYVGDQATTGLAHEDVINRVALAQQLLLAGEDKSDELTPSRHIWDHLDRDARSAVAKVALPQEVQGRESMLAFDKMVRSLAKQIDDTDWYDPQVFKGVRLRREGRTLLDKREKEELTDIEKKRLNRLLLEGSFPESISFSPPTSVAVGYFIWGPQQVPMTREQLKETLPPFIVVVLDYTFGVFGILAALLITAPIMPQLFEPGSLHLLLSKPVSRSLLFLTKFCGGCAFALISSAYFALGMWLLLGTRLAIWDSRLLAAIPVYTFVFAIYYSVTALAGLLFRNTIVAVVLGILFWFTCWGAGVIENTLQFFVVGQSRINRLAVAGDSILAVFLDDQAQIPGTSFVVREFDSAEAKWTTVYRSQAEGPEQFNHTYPEFGPFYDHEHDQVVSLQKSTFRGSENALSVAPRSPLWPRSRGAALPSTTVAIGMDRQSRVIAVGLDGIHRSTKNVGLTDDKTKVLGFSLPWGTAATAFEKASEGEWPFVTQPIVMALDPATDAVALWSRGQVAVWVPDNKGRYREHVSRTIEEEEKTDMLVGISDGRVLLAAKDGRILLLDAETLKTHSELSPEGKNSPRAVRSSLDGDTFAVLFTHGKLWTIDAKTGSSSLARVPGQGTISALVFEPDGDLLVAHHANRVSRCSLSTGNSELICKPALSTLESVYYYAIRPVYTVLPKPGELYRTLLYLLTGKEANTADSGPQIPQEFVYTEKAQPWQPVWSGAIFLAVMLAIGCLYMERMEF